jgi:hypothetical protein
MAIKSVTSSHAAKTLVTIEASFTIHSASDVDVEKSYVKE